MVAQCFVTYTEVTSHPFCYILVIRSMLLGEDYTGHEYQAAGSLGVSVEGCLPTSDTDLNLIFSCS